MTEKKTIEVSLKEVQDVYDLLEEINHLFHQPMYYQDKEMVEIFAKKNHKKISELYYKKVWQWLPQEIQEKYINR